MIGQQSRAAVLNRSSRGQQVDADLDEVEEFRDKYQIRIG
jgi:hypothetical protein